MKPFHTIAVPHRDILEGRLTMDVFAADLWETYKKRSAQRNTVMLKPFSRRHTSRTG